MKKAKVNSNYGAKSPNNSSAVSVNGQCQKGFLLSFFLYSRPSVLRFSGLEYLLSHIMILIQMDGAWHNTSINMDFFIQYKEAAGEVGLGPISELDLDQF